MSAEIEQILIDLTEYFEDKCDADYDYEAQRFIPNEEMRLLAKVDRLTQILNKPLIAQYDYDLKTTIVE